MTDARVGLDIGGTAVKAGRVAPDGTVEAELSRDLPPERTREGFLEFLVDVARELGAEGALGVGVPGYLDRERGCVSLSPNLPQLDELPLRDGLAAAFGLDRAHVVVENDANVATLGEQWRGGGRGRDDLFLLTLGTGVGGGLVLGGELVRGSGQAGEIGHLVLHRGGRECGCGNRGCLEQYASATAAMRRAREAGLVDDLAELAGRARRDAGPERELLEAVGRDLGLGVGAVVTLVDVRSFVFGGGFSAALDVLEPGIRAGLRESSFGDRVRGVELLRAELGPAAGWIGAARLVL